MIFTCTPKKTGSLIYLFRNNVALPSTQDCPHWKKYPLDSGRDVKDYNSVRMICNNSDNGIYLESLHWRSDYDDDLGVVSA